MSIIGRGRGLDHVLVAVNDLYEARDDYRKKLGFSPAFEAIHPWGTRSSAIFFEGLESLQLVEVYDREKADTDYLDVLEKREGPCAITFEVPSIERTAKMLRSKGFVVSNLNSGTAQYENIETPPELWKGLSVWKLPFLGMIGFVQYNKMARYQLLRKHRHVDPRRHTKHPNTAKTLRAVWLAVESLTDSVSILERIGFRRGEFVGLNHLGARGCEIEAGESSILLVEPVDKRGIAGRFIEDYGQDFIGVSIEVEDFDSARDFVEIMGDLRLLPYAGTYGQSILVPSKSAHGLWIELFQRK